MKVFRVENTEDEQIGWTCPGCGSMHMIPTKGQKGWTWNGDVDKPTISPSIKSMWGPNKQGKQEICHFFVKEGKINFCNDCTHDLNGKQGVEMVEEKPKYIN